MNKPLLRPRFYSTPWLARKLKNPEIKILVDAASKWKEPAQANVPRQTWEAIKDGIDLKEVVEPTKKYRFRTADLQKAKKYFEKRAGSPAPQALIDALSDRLAPRAHGDQLQELMRENHQLAQKNHQLSQWTSTQMWHWSRKNVLNPAGRWAAFAGGHALARLPYLGGVGFLVSFSVDVGLFIFRDIGGCLLGAAVGALTKNAVNEKVKQRLENIFFEVCADNSTSKDAASFAQEAYNRANLKNASVDQKIEALQDSLKDFFKLGVTPKSGEGRLNPYLCTAVDQARNHATRIKQAGNPGGVSDCAALAIALGVPIRVTVTDQRRTYHREDEDAAADDGVLTIEKSSDGHYFAANAAGGERSEDSFSALCAALAKKSPEFIVSITDNLEEAEKIKFTEAFAPQGALAKAGIQLLRHLSSQVHEKGANVKIVDDKGMESVETVEEILQDEVRRSDSDAGDVMKKKAREHFLTDLKSINIGNHSEFLLQKHADILSQKGLKQHFIADREVQNSYKRAASEFYVNLRNNSESKDPGELWKFAKRIKPTWSEAEKAAFEESLKLGSRLDQLVPPMPGQEWRRSHS